MALGVEITDLQFHLRNVLGNDLLRTNVKFWTTSKQRRNVSRHAAVALMISLWVAIWAIEVSPDLHHLLHPDAQSPDHHCLITQLQHQSVTSGCVAAAAPPLPEVSCALIGCGDFHFYPSYDYRLTPSRGPPAV